MTKRARAIVLAEDKCHQDFIRPYLKHYLKSPRYDIYFEPLPAGKGAGEQWVRLRYAKQVQVYRSRAAKTASIVMIDADAGTVPEHFRQLAEALKKNGLPPLQSTEMIVRLIPKWSIETWILCLTGTEVIEETSYRHDHRINPERIQASAKVLFVWTRPKAHVPKHCVPSLTSALPEVRKLEQLEKDAARTPTRKK